MILDPLLTVIFRMSYQALPCIPLGISLLRSHKSIYQVLPSTSSKCSITMESLSAIASIISEIDVALRITTALYAYLKDVNNATSNKILLAEEVSTLLRVLDILYTRAKKNQNQIWSRQQKHLINSMARACEDLIKILNFDIATGKFI